MMACMGNPAWQVAPVSFTAHAKGPPQPCDLQRTGSALLATSSTTQTNGCIAQVQAIRLAFKLYCPTRGSGLKAVCINQVL